MNPKTIVADSYESAVKSIQEQIDERGWGMMTHVCKLEGVDKLMRCAFTVGLTAHGLPEVIVFGPEEKEQWVAATCGTVADCMLQLERPVLGRSNLHKHDGTIVKIATAPVQPDESLYFLNIIQEMQQKPYTMVQTVWSDDQGYFPFDDEYDQQTNPQQLLSPPDNYQEIITKYIAQAMNRTTH